MTGVRKVPLDWSGLEVAFENHSPETRCYVDRTSGEVLTVLGEDSTDDVQKRIAAEPDRFLRIEPLPSREQYRMMERFIATVQHAELKERLQDSIVGKGAFRRFKDVVTQYSEERKRWFTFRDVLAHQYVLDWLKQHRVDALEAAPWNMQLPPDPEAPGVGAATPEPDPEEGRPEITHLKRYLQSWARAHGEEYAFIFGPSAFDRLAEDVSGEFTFIRRR